MSQLDNISALILGIVEGLTEFLPISSTGHLILAGHWLGVGGQSVKTFEIFIQLGAILAVVYLYFKTFLGLLDFSPSTSQHSFMGWSGIKKLGLACLPAFLIGPFVASAIKQHLFYPRPVALALLIGGILLIWIEARKRQPQSGGIESISGKQALCIGLFQCLSFWPGMSRSASTILGGMLLGLDRRVAAEFSFLVAVPVMTAATLYDLFKSLSFLTAADAGPFTIGFVVSFVTAVLAMRFFVALLGRMTLKVFGLYRIGLALLVFWLLS